MRADRSRRIRSTASIALLLLVASGQLCSEAASADGAADTVKLKYEYVGYRGGNKGDPDECPDSRRDGRLVVEGTLERTSGGPGDVKYEGKGHVDVNIDECIVGGDGGRDSKDYCRVTIVARHEVDLLFYVKTQVQLVPTARGPVAATVTGNCDDPEPLATFRGEVAAGRYRAYEEGLLPTAHDGVLALVAPEGVPRPGRYEDPDAGDRLAGEGHWTLVIDGATDDVQVAIAGPTCACLEGETAAPKVLDFTARASRGGGTFGRWVVSAEGETPRELRNDGGATAGLSLGVTRETRGVAVAISYSRDGKSYRSDPHAVTVCVMDSIATPDGATDISFDDGDPGRAVVRANSRASVGGRDASADIGWTLDEIEDGTTLAAGTAKGAEAEFTYTSLPTTNASFGKRTLTARVEGDGCACTRASVVRIFFAPFATNHPQPSAPPDGTDAPTPNWFYYWMQTGAARGATPALIAFQRTIAPENLPPAGAPPPMINGRYVEAADRVLIAGRVPRRGACRARMVQGSPPRATGVAATGVDCFAETLAHEWHHRVEYRQWWSGGYDRASDLDGDRVPNGVEAQEPGCSRVNPLSCDGRPFPDATDRELSAYWVGWAWPLGSANAEDWTCLGKQWRGAVCPMPGSLPP